MTSILRTHILNVKVFSFKIQECDRQTDWKKKSTPNCYKAVGYDEWTINVTNYYHSSQWEIMYIMCGNKKLCQDPN